MGRFLSCVSHFKSSLRVAATEWTCALGLCGLPISLFLPPHICGGSKCPSESHTSKAQFMGKHRQGSLCCVSSMAVSSVAHREPKEPVLQHQSLGLFSPHELPSPQLIPQVQPKQRSQIVTPVSVLLESALSSFSGLVRNQTPGETVRSDCAHFLPVPTRTGFSALNMHKLSFAHIDIYTCTQTHTYILSHTYNPICSHTYIQTFTHTFIYSHIHIYMYIHTHTNSPVSPTGCFQISG